MKPRSIMVRLNDFLGGFDEIVLPILANETLNYTFLKKSLNKICTFSLKLFLSRPITNDHSEK